MKNSKLKNVAWVCFALMLATSTAFSQGRKNDYRNCQDQSSRCDVGISGLTEEQEKQIAKIEKEHQNVMAEMRLKRRSTINAVKKSEIRTEMLRNVETHRQAVKATLSEEQIKEYELLHAYGNGQRNGRYAAGRGYGAYGNYASRGNGNGYHSRGNGRGFSNAQGNGNNSLRGGRYRRSSQVDSCSHVSSISNEGFEVIESNEEQF